MFFKGKIVFIIFIMSYFLYGLEIKKNIKYYLCFNYSIDGSIFLNKKINSLFKISQGLDKNKYYLNYYKVEYKNKQIYKIYQLTTQNNKIQKIYYFKNNKLVKIEYLEELNYICNIKRKEFKEIRECTNNTKVVNIGKKIDSKYYIFKQYVYSNNKLIKYYKMDNNFKIRLYDLENLTKKEFDYIDKSEICGVPQHIRN